MSRGAGAWPTVFSSQADVLPAWGTDVGQELGWDFEAGFPPGEDGVAKLQRVPGEDDRGQQVEVGDPVVLPFPGSVPQFATLMEIDGALEGMAHRETSMSQLCRELGNKPVTLYRYVGPQGQLRQQGEKVLA